jgi:branched-chain amino acid transport system ATP-binding protein
VSLLSVRDLRVSYGQVAAVKDVSLEIRNGEQVCLIGANGAGKTTLLKALSGILPFRGSLHYDGADMTHAPAHERARRGLALVPEGRGIFARMTVIENLHLGAYARRDGERIREDLDRAFDLFPRLAERREQVAGTLSGGEQQMLAIARALMGRPRLLLLDEPSMGLAPIMVQRIFEILKRVAAEGVTLLLVEQNARLALEACQRGYVMENGHIILANESRVLLGSERVQQAYLGVGL